MPTFTDPFDGSVFNEDYYWKTGYIQTSYVTASGYLHMYQQDNYVVEGTWMTLSRFKYNLAFEVCLEVTAGSVYPSGQKWYVGFLNWEEDVGSGYLTGDFEFKMYADGVVEMRGTANYQYLDTGSKYWIKTVITETTMQKWFKPDNGTYVMLGEYSIPTLFTNFEYYYNGAKLACYTKNVSPYDDMFMRFYEVNITADQGDLFDNWPSDLYPSFQAAKCIMSTEFPPYVPEPEPIWKEEFDYSHNSTEYTEVPLDLVLNDEDKLIFDVPGDETETEVDYWWVFYNEYVAGEVEITFKMEPVEIPDGTVFDARLWDKNEYRHVSLYFQGKPNGEQQLQFDVNTIDGYEAVFIAYNSACFFPGITRYYRIKQNPDLSFSLYTRMEGCEWIHLGTSTVKSDVFKDGCKLEFGYQNWDVNNSPLLVKIDHVWVNSKYNTYIGNWFGSMLCDDSDMGLPTCKMYSGWSVALGYNFNDGDQLFDRDFHLPIPEVGYYSDPIYMDIAAAEPGDLMPFMKVKGDLYIENAIHYFPYLTSVGDYCGWTFTINDIPIFFGYINDATLGKRLGITIDGVLYARDTVGVSSSYESILHLELRGTHLTVDVGEDYWAGRFLDRIYDDTNFLGGPAEYVTDDLAWKREESTSNDYTRMYWLWIMGEEGLPNNLFGSVDLCTEYIRVTFLGLMYAPPVANPGYFFHRTEVVGGGTNSLDGVDPTNIDNTKQPMLEWSTCMVITAQNDIYIYRAHEQAGQVESFPDIIIPDNNPGDWYWQLVKCRVFSPATVTQFNNLLETPQVPFDFQPGSSSHVINIDNNGLVAVRDVEISQDGSGVCASGSDHENKTNIITIPFTPLVQT